MLNSRSRASTPTNGKFRDFFMTIQPNIDETPVAFRARVLNYGSIGIEGAKYTIASVEVGSESAARAVAAGLDPSEAVPHGHALIVMNNATTGRSILAKCGGRGHFERKRGTYAQAIDYIKKV